MTWIPVGERLPEEGVQVIAHDTTDGSTFFAQHWPQYDGWVTRDGYDEFPCAVTHWQPLPEPPGND